MSDIPTLTIHFDPPKDNKEVTVKLECSECVSDERKPYNLTLPFDLEQTQLVLRALDTRQYPDYPSKERLFRLNDIREQIILQLQALGLWDGDERTGAVAADAHERIGRQLGTAFMSDPLVKKHFNVLYDAVRKNMEKQGEIILSFAPNAENLASLPWEAMYDSIDPVLLTQGIALNCTRIVEFEHSIPSYLPIKDPLRVLIVTPNAGMDSIKQAFIENARFKMVKELKEELGAEIEWIGGHNKPAATIDSLSEHLRQEPAFHILNYIGHGISSDEGDALLLDDGPFSASKLAKLPNLPPLIVLHACQSAHVGTNNPLSALAIALSSSGVRAVLAMQLTIRLEAVANHITPTFYRELAKAKSVQQAITAVRRTLYTEEHDTVSWYVPVLYLRQPQPFYLPDRPLLCPDNPFANTKPIKDYNHLIGRKDEMKAIRTRLNKGMNSFSIIGDPGSGRSTMLNLIYENKKELAAGARVVWLMLDRDTRLSQVKKRLADELTGEQEPLYARPKDCESVLRDGKRTIILIDNLSNLSTTNEKAWEVRYWFKSLLDHPKMQVQIVASSEEPLEKVFEADSRVRYGGAPLHSVLTDKIYLNPFTDEEAREFIIKALVGTPFHIKDFVGLLTESMVPKELREACEKQYSKLRDERGYKSISFDELNA